MKKIFVAFVFLGLFNNQLIYTQNKFIEACQFGLWFGFRDLQIDSLPNAQNLDFINYMSYNDYFPVGYPYLGFSVQLQIKNNWQVDAKVFTTDDIIPTSFNLSVQHYFSKYMGFNLGFYTYPLLTSDYERYHNIEDTDFYPVPSGSRQHNIYDAGIIGGPVFSVSRKVFFANLKLNIGYSGFVPFKEEFFREKINSNFQRIVKYETHYNMGFFFFPEIKAGLNLFSRNNITIGLQLQADAFFSKRNLKYTRTTYNWTMNDPVVEKISNPKHQYNLFDWDFGIFLRFLPKE